MQQLQKQQLEKFTALRKPLEERVKDSIRQVEEGKVITFNKMQEKYDKRYGNK